MTNKSSAGAVESSQTQPVVVVDVQMKFTSMVVFMVKWALAAIPALVILIVIGVAATVFVQSVVQVLWTEYGQPRVTDPASNSAPTPNVMREASEQDFVKVRDEARRLIDSDRAMEAYGLLLNAQSELRYKPEWRRVLNDLQAEASLKSR
jgi:hypothetical protein